MEQIMTQFSNSLGGGLPSVVGAIIFLIIGWIFALIVSSLVRKLMSTLSVNERFSTSTEGGNGLDIENIGAKLAFWFVFIFAITGALDKLQLQAVSAPLANLLNQVTSFIPSLIGAAIIGLIGFVIATVVKNGSTKLLSNTSLDQKLSSDAGMPPMSNTIGTLLFWLVILMFIPMVLDKLNMKGLLAPVQNMIDEMLAFLPNLFGAAVILGIGYIIAKVLRNVVTSLVSGLNIQGLANKAGLKDASNLPKLAGSIVFFLILMPVLVSALDKLGIEAISRPATNMLNKIMDAFPNVLMAIVTLAIFYFIFKFVANLVTEVLSNTGVDSFPEKMGLGDAFGETKLSSLVGTVILAFAMLFGTVEAANLIGFTSLRDIVATFMEFGGKILFGGIILMAGFWIANTVSGIVSRSQEGSEWLGTLVKVVIMGLVLAMGLKSMGIADSIVNMAFGLTLGAAAVAFAISFGLGGREAAARVLKNALDKVEEKK